MEQALKSLNIENQFVEMHSDHNLAERSRLDLTLENGKLGLYAKDRSGVVDMYQCPMADPELNKALEFLRRTQLPDIKKGSLRLRVSPKGDWGLWLDFANVDVKTILDEKTWLESLRSKFMIEIGQRNKRLIEKDGQLKLGDPELYPWFETYLGEELSPQNLYLPLAGFTQTGFKMNRLLVSTAMQRLKKIKATQVLELFCGSGNFTLAMASRGLKVTAIELDRLALEGLDKSLTEADLKDQVEVLRKDLYRHSVEEFEAPVWWVDPPRSGLKGVLKVLASMTKRPQTIVYVSCFLKSWCEDANQLIEMGYKLQSVEGIDQFPNTPHCEWLTVFVL